MAALDIEGRQITRLEILDYDLVIYPSEEKFSLKGVTILQCSDNQLTSLPPLPDSILKIACNNNQLTSLPNLPKNLTDLACADNQLTTLPPLPLTIQHIWCYNNSIRALPELPDSLLMLYCSNNQLQTLPKLPRRLVILDCIGNQLTTLSGLPGPLFMLDCSDNPLIFVEPLSSRHSDYQFPDNLAKLHSEENYLKYYHQYVIYRYLVAFCVFGDISHSIIEKFYGSFFD